ncbi:MAG: hypothetical protein Q8L27_00110 [archaeon]|nr:hypothetical protein [archaeon]
MKKEILMGIVTAFLLGACVFIYVTSSSGVTFFAISEGGVCKTMDCITESFSSCTPAIANWKTELNGQSITANIEILGVVDNLCGFKMYSGDLIIRECYFPLDSLGAGLTEQFFSGKDNGFSQVIADSCRQ